MKFKNRIIQPKEGRSKKNLEKAKVKE